MEGHGEVEILNLYNRLGNLGRNKEGEVEEKKTERRKIKKKKE
jgi:hypothetical protein